MGDCFYCSKAEPVVQTKAGKIRGFKMNSTYTFHLEEGVKWHDGEPFTSADVKWTYDTLMAEKWAKSDNFTTVESI